MVSVDSSRTLLGSNGFALSRTSGKSMRPIIWGGQHCVAVVPLEDEPQPGSLLMFRQGGPDGKNIIHRLVETRRDGCGLLYITRGDNCLTTESVRHSDIIGVVAEVHRISGFRPWHAIPTRRFAVSDRAFMVYSRIWKAIWPVRRICYVVRGYASGALRRLKTMFSRV